MSETQVTTLPDPESIAQYARAMKAIFDFELEALQPRKRLPGSRPTLLTTVGAAIGLDAHTVELNRLHLRQSQEVWLARYAQIKRKTAGPEKAMAAGA